MNLLDISRQIRNKQTSPTEVVQQTLNRINNNDIYNAFITVCEEEAMAEATLLEEELIDGKSRGPFHGIPIAIKDVIYTKGIRTTMGSKLYENYVPDYNATVIQKIIDAGMIIIGKTHNHEFAYGPTGDRSFFGPCRNPHNVDKITGGSSSGSGAAIAADMVYAALGTDTGGSIRIPASACGVVGMKPTFGLISKYGVHSTAYTLDHVGPMTKTIKENAILLNLLAGLNQKDQHSINYLGEDYTHLLGKSIAGKVIGIPSFYYQNIDEEVSESLDKCIKLYQEQGTFVKKVFMPRMDEISRAQKVTIRAESYAVHNENIRTRSSDYGEEVRDRLLSGKDVLASEYTLEQDKRKELTYTFNETFKKVNMLLTPTLPILPTDINQREVFINGQSRSVQPELLRLTAPTNLTGNPSLSVPCGLSSNGLPIGFQLIGKHGQESMLYQFGYAYEQQYGEF